MSLNSHSLDVEPLEVVLLVVEVTVADELVVEVKVVLVDLEMPTLGRCYDMSGCCWWGIHQTDHNTEMQPIPSF